MSLYTQISDIQYPDQEARDANRQVIGGGYSQFFAGKYNPLIFAGLYAGNEEQQEGNAPQLDYEFTGVRLGGQAKFTRSITAYASASLERRSYGEEDPFFLKTRKDDYSSYTVGARYEYNRELSFSPELVSSQNASNIDFYDTEKLAYSVTARYEF